jgi:predicted alpha/beta-hydrolase family hydrolase
VNDVPVAAYAAELQTPRGLARVDLAVPAGRTVSLLALGHGAGGQVTAPDLSAVREAALAVGVAVARVTQPYRVAGRRAPAAAPALDEAWSTVLATLTGATGGDGLSGVPTMAGLPLVVGGRSSGARVACRTARSLGALGVVALAFPLHAPSRMKPAESGQSALASRPERSRAEELLTGLPTLVINGDRDPFGVPEPGPGIELVVRPGERHDLRGDPASVGAAVVDWLRRHKWARR